MGLLKEALIQIGSGGTAGFVEVCIMHPLDVVKTRLQIQRIRPRDVSKEDLQNFRGVIDCFSKTVRHEGVLALWKGIIPPILAETPKRACKFFCFEQFKPLFMFGSSKPTPLTFSCAGLGAGMVEAILVNPFEVVKVTMQSNFAKGDKMPSTWEVTKNIIQTNGWGTSGINKGVTATIARNGAFNMVYFGFYHSVKNYLPTAQDPALEFLRKVVIGFCSGTFASCFNIPFDVAKSRIQGPQPVPGEIKYKGVFQSVGLIYKEEGALALYKGLLPKVLRLGPGGAIMLVTYDYMHQLLTEKFKD